MKKVIIILCLFWMGFIFYMSSNNGQISHEKSIKVVDFVDNVKNKFQSKEDINKETNKLQSNESTDKKTNTNNVNEQVMINNKLDYIVRKNAHAFLYMVLAILVGGSFFCSNKKGKDAIIYILFICLFYAVTDEYHQSFVDGRTSLVSDVLVDFLGTLIGTALFYISYYNLYEKVIGKKIKG